MSIYRNSAIACGKIIGEGDILIFGKGLTYKVKKGCLRRVFRPLSFLFSHFCLLIPDLNNTIFKVTGIKTIPFSKEERIYKPDKKLSSELNEKHHHILTAITKELFVQMELSDVCKKEAIKKAISVKLKKEEYVSKKEEYRKDPIKAVKYFAEKRGIKIAFAH